MSDGMGDLSEELSPSQPSPAPTSSASSRVAFTIDPCLHIYPAPDSCPSQGPWLLLAPVSSYLTMPGTTSFRLGYKLQGGGNSQPPCGQQCRPTVVSQEVRGLLGTIPMLCGCQRPQAVPCRCRDPMGGFTWL